MTTRLTREIVLGDAGGRSPVPVLWLSWSAADPLAVTLVLTGRPPHPSAMQGRWVVLRDALRDVLRADRPVTTPHGVEHVRMTAVDGWLTLTLQSGTLPFVVTVPTGPVRAFLADTELHVPAGTETCGQALEAEIARMLGD